MIVLVVYGVIGLGALVLAVRRDAGALRISAAFLLWPFYLPLWLSSGDPADPRRARLLRAAAAVRDGLARAPTLGGARAVTAWVDGLDRELGRLAELEQALQVAQPNVRVQLGRIRDTMAERLDGSLQVLDELAGQLVLLRFVDMAERDDAVHEQVERLLGVIEARMMLVDVSAPTGAGTANGPVGGEATLG